MGAPYDKVAWLRRMFRHAALVIERGELRSWWKVSA